MDLISRSELVKLLEDRKREHYENYESFRNYMGNRRLEHETEYEECKRILTIVANQPTVEAVPVVHGEWIRKRENPMEITCECSVCHVKTYLCGKHFDTEYYWFSRKFCPNCGADMRTSAK